MDLSVASYLFLHWPALTAVQVGDNMKDILKLANCVGNNASETKQGSFDGPWYTEHNGTTFVATYVGGDICIIKTHVPGKNTRLWNKSGVSGMTISGWQRPNRISMPN